MVLDTPLTVLEILPQGAGNAALKALRLTPSRKSEWELAMLSEHDFALHLQMPLYQQLGEEPG